MNKLCVVALALVFTSFGAQAVEPVSTPLKTAQSVPAATSTAAPKPVALSQQDKMRECNKQATGKKGSERKDFMKTCLSRKV
jgi:hypothetical protein